jgi:hypothetical protein
VENNFEKVFYTENALISLEEIIEFYICEIGIPPEKVDKIVSNLFIKSDSLIENPFLNQIEPYLVDFRKEHRRLIVDNIKVIYRIEGKTIFVTDFFDVRRNPKKMKP